MVVSEKVAIFAPTWLIVAHLLFRLLLIKRWTTNPDSLEELSIQERFTCVEVTSTATRFEGAVGATGLGVGVGVGVAVGEGVGDGVGVGVTVGVGTGLTVGVGVGVGVGLETVMLTADAVPTFPAAS